MPGMTAYVVKVDGPDKCVAKRANALTIRMINRIHATTHIGTPEAARLHKRADDLLRIHREASGTKPPPVFYESHPRQKVSEPA